MTPKVSNNEHVNLIAAKDAAWDAYLASGSQTDLNTAVTLDRELEQVRMQRGDKGEQE